MQLPLHEEGVSIRAVRAALAEHYGLDAREFIRLSGGYIHRVWSVQTSGGKRVIKLYTGVEWTVESVAPTLATQSYAASAGHPVPTVHRTRTGDWLAPAAGGWMAVFDHGTGRHLAPPELNDEAAAAAGATLGRLHRTLATLRVGDAAPFIPEAEAVRERALRLLVQAEARPNADEMDHFAAAAARFRLELLDRRPIDPGLYAGARHQIVHGDYYPGNLLFTPAGAVSAILDWDFSSARWRELEVARAAVETALTGEGELDRERLGAFISAYASEERLSQAQRRGMFRVWLNHLLFSLYPLPLRYQPEAVLPQGWEQLARVRHRMLVLLHRCLTELERWAGGEG